MCKPQEISNWLRSVYRISAGKWIPGRNKKPPLFCRFLRNWRYLNKNKNKRSSWSFCKIFENFLYLLILLLSQFSFFMFLYHTFGTSPSFSCFYRLWISTQNYESCGQWWEVKKTRLFMLTFNPSKWSRLTHVTCGVCFFFFSWQ